MCGIAGYADASGGLIQRDILEQMAERLGHRGPDARGALALAGCGLAHTRLSIIDLDASSQPMQTADGRFSLTFNGEIYNYLELRERLVREGVEFRTSGDTEVLLESLARSGAEAIDTLDGMFGFAAWDAIEHKLLLARDPLGVKPLYYAQPRPDVLVFGSEIKALFAHPEMQPALEEGALVESLRFRAVYGDRSIYAGVQQLRPGQALWWCDGRVTAFAHYDLIERVRTEAERWSPESAEARNDECLDRFRAAIEKRLIADVPVGSFLSGGLDSSLIVAQTKKLRPETELHTFAVGFDGDPRSELPSAARVAALLHTNHHEVRVSLDDYIEQLPLLTHVRGAPLSEPADIAVALMSRQARKEVKVVLSGEGADEAFCGYPKYRFAESGSFVGRLSRLIGSDRLTGAAAFLGLDRRRARIALRSIAEPDEAERLACWFSYLDRTDLGKMFGGLDLSDDVWAATLDRHRTLLAQMDGLSKTQRMQLIDCLNWLPGNLLERGDRMTMSCGLEMRVPFLDKSLVPFAIALPRHQKIQRHSSKHLIRQFARELLPPETIAKRKWGFRVPLQTWFRGRLGDYLLDLVQGQRSLAREFGSPGDVEILLAEHRRENHDHDLALWTLLANEVWYQHVLN